MAETFAIIGLASSIVAFVDFSLKTIAAVKLARDSVHGGIPEAHEIELILQDVKLSNITVTQGSIGRTLAPGEKHVMALATECERLAGELGDIIQKFKMRDGARSKSIESARLAVQMLRKRKDIEDLGRRIKNMDERIRENVRGILDKERNSVFLSELRDLGRLQRQHQINYDSKLDHLQDTVLELAAGARDAQGDQLVALKEHLDLLEQERITRGRQSRIIRSLYFPELRRRWSDIADSDQFTNTWLFDPTKTNFLEWLRTGNGIYWVSGKAGSGKSTLMKFAATHNDSNNALKEWAGSAPLYTASHYFWNQGFEMQKSQVGLLQSLLYQILRQAPALIPHVCPADRMEHERWEIADLTAAFGFLVKHNGLPTKSCFFIDGLDEYGGEEEDMVKILTFLVNSRSADIKICVSSRPRDAFKPFQKGKYSFEIQNFTKADMETHVRQRLQTNLKFQALEVSQKSRDGLIAHIAEKSSGVWLWVFLVTRDIVHAVNRNEDLLTLQRILEHFPSDLEAYFEHIIHNIKSVYRQDMARIFLVAVEAVEPLPLWAFSLLEKEQADPDYALSARIRPLDAIGVAASDEQRKSRIQNRCGDLLIVSKSYPKMYFVDFLHRTVRDFLRDCYYNRLQDLILSSPTPTFDPLISLCKIILYILKSTLVSDFHSGPPLSFALELADQLLDYAYEIEKRLPNPEAPTPVADLLDELDRVNTAHASRMSSYSPPSYPPHYTKHWVEEYHPPRVRVPEEYGVGGNYMFLSLATRKRLTRYVRAKLGADPSLLRTKAGRPLLDYALRPRRERTLRAWYPPRRDDPSVDVSMARMLLEAGASPNQKVHLDEGGTVWALFLAACYDSVRRGKVTGASERLAWFEACELLCRYGAQDDGRWFSPLGVVGTLRMIFGEERAKYLVGLRRREAQAPPPPPPPRLGVSFASKLWRFILWSKDSLPDKI